MRARAGVVAAALLLGLPAAAAAHVDVLPLQATEGVAQEFTVRVPTERPLPTVAVRVLFPPQVTVYAFADPPPGWTMRTLLAPDGRNRGVEYRGGSIPVGGYQDFTFLGTPFQRGTAVWKSFQTYADGKVKPWTGPPEPPGAASPETGPTVAGPAAATQILAPGAAAAATTPAAAGVTQASGGSSSGAGVWLGLIAIAIAAMAAVGAGLLWSSRPVDLPQDDDGSGDGGPAAEPGSGPAPAAGGEAATAPARGRAKRSRRRRR